MTAKKVHKQHVQLLIVHVMICHFMMSLSTTDAELHCLMGHTKQPSLGEVSCASSVVYNHTLRASNGSTSQVPINSSQCQSDQKQDVKYCIIFKYVGSEMADFMCDCDQECSKQTAAATKPSNFSVTQFEYKGSLGTLYCCDSPRCNQRSVLDSIPKSLQCYVGADGTKDLGVCVNNSCLATTVSASKPWAEPTSYSCDTQNICRRYNVTDGTCQTVTDSGTQKKICCCSQNGCNSGGQGQSVSLHPLSTMATPTSPDAVTHKLRHWMFIGGIAAGVVLGLLVFILVAVYLKRFKQKQSAQLTYTYAQLTEDLAEEREPLDVADERMLVG